jgi:C4-dicarboxylate transporter DctM subunit
MIPALKKYGYDEEFATGLVTSAGSLGIVIPPSIPMILYCLVMNVSVAKLFMAGIGPGILIGAVFAGYTIFKAKRHGWSSHRKYSLSESIAVLRDGVWGLMLPIIVLGGIYTGIFTPTEAAAVSVVYALFVEFFIYKELTLKKLTKILKDSAVLSGALLFILSCAMTFVWLLTSEQIPQQVADAVIHYVHNWWTFLIAVNILFLIMGTFMDDVSAMLILSPIFLETLHRFHIDLIHYGVVMVLVIEFGFLTPPFGLNLFVTMGITKWPLTRVARSVAPFIFLLLLCVALVTFIPQISMFLPNFFYR